VTTMSPEIDPAVFGEPDPSPDSEADLANARRLAATHGEHLRYVVPWKKWLCWDGRRWKLDETGEAARCAKAVADTLPKKTKAGRPARAQTAAGINAMLALAATEPDIAVAPAMLDAKPHLLNVANGTLDLRTGQLRPHDPADLITKVCNAAYDPDAEAPEFAAFLRRVQPDEAMRGFLARLFGNALEGVVTEHVLPVFYGVGANGKTTLVETLAYVLGDYARPVDPGLLLARGEVHPTGLAALFGLRLALTHETDEGRRLSEATVKRLTGGDTITARRMHEDFWDFAPSHTIVMHTNHKPIVRGTDEGVWRRLKLIPFAVVVPPEEQDAKLPGRMRAEADGILAWAVAGHGEWQDRGLAEPGAVTAATSTYRSESDTLAAFLAERCMPNPHAHVRSAELFAAWVEWCRRENVDAGTHTAFSRNLQDRGYEKKRGTGGTKIWLGISLYADEEAPK